MSRCGIYRLAALKYGLPSQFHNVIFAEFTQLAELNLMSIVLANSISKSNAPNE